MQLSRERERRRADGARVRLDRHGGERRRRARAMPGKSSGGTARRSKKLLALYSLQPVRHWIDDVVRSTLLQLRRQRAGGVGAVDRVAPQVAERAGERTLGAGEKDRQGTLDRFRPAGAPPRRASRAPGTDRRTASVDGDFESAGRRPIAVTRAAACSVSKVAPVARLRPAGTSERPAPPRPSRAGSGASGRYGHLDAEHRANSARHDLPLERVQPLVRALRQLGERNRLGHRDDRRPRVRTELLEAVSRARTRSSRTQPRLYPPEYVSECLIDSTPQPSW